MAIENYTNIKVSEVMEGSFNLEPSLLIPIIILCFGLAFGAQWGFDRIYDLKRLKNFKKFKSELISNFRIKLKQITLDDKKEEIAFNEEINEFVEEWQDFQDNIKISYDKLIWWRKEILIIFCMAGISFFLRLIRPDLLLSGYKIVLISNWLFLLGLISISVFVYKIINLESKIAKYILDKPLIKNGNE